MKLANRLSVAFLVINVDHAGSFSIDTKLSSNYNVAGRTKTKLQSTKEKEDILLYNSLTNNKEVFKSCSSENNDEEDPTRVSIYTCGPTVYDHAHIGNFRAFLTYDVLKRTLEYFGYNVTHICNLTDIDDKIIARCDREEISNILELTRKFEGLFMEDLAALNIIPANEYPRATDHINEMVDLIKDLERNGLAYQSDEGSWYFNVGKKEGYGKQLVNLDVKKMMVGASGDAGSRRGEDADEYDADKVGVRDFALWKAYKPNFDREDAVWDVSIGKGRPGWHLECSAMARKYLGDTIDIHCGGIDLKFPHHENEIAQSEGATSKKYVNYWVHNGFVNIGEEKMSKSKGNFLTLRTACPKDDDVRAYRYLVVSSQYRNPLTFTQKTLDASKSALKRIDKVRLQLSVILGETEATTSDSAIDDDSESSQKTDITKQVQKHLNNYNLALLDDLSMPRAAASLFAIVKLAEMHFKEINKDDSLSYDMDGLHSVQHAFIQMDKVFGIFYTVPNLNHDEDDNDDDSLECIVPEDVMELVTQRIEAKKEKEWELADNLRNQVIELGFSIKDVKEGVPLVTRLD